MTKRTIALSALLTCIAMLVTVAMREQVSFAVQQDALPELVPPSVPSARTVGGVNSQQARTLPPTAVVPPNPGPLVVPSGVPTVQGFSTAAPMAYAAGQNTDRGFVQKIKDAKNDDERQDAIGEAREKLEKEYDRYLESSEKQIEQLEARLKKLRQHLKKRRDAKDRLVDLKLELIISQADGIGWPGEGRSLQRVMGFPTAPAVPFAPGANRVPNAPMPGFFPGAHGDGVGRADSRPAVQRTVPPAAPTTPSIRRPNRTRRSPADRPDRPDQTSADSSGSNTIQ